MSETIEQLTTAVVAWARLVLGASPKVFLGGTGAVAEDPCVFLTVRNSTPDAPVEVVLDGTAVMRSQYEVTTIEIAVMGQTGAPEIARRLVTAWTSEGDTSAPLRAAYVVPIDDGATLVDGFRRLEGAGLVPVVVTTISARHRVGWRTETGAGPLVTEINGTIEGEPDVDAAFVFRLATVLQVGSSLLTVGPSALELSA